MREPPPAPAKLFTSSVLLLLVLLALIVGHRALSRAFYPYPSDSSEGVVLAAAWHGATGQPVYGTTDQFPVCLTVYGPILPWLGALMVSLFGGVPAAVRAVGLACYLATGALVFAIVKRQTASWNAALVAGLFVLVERHLVSRAGLAVSEFPALAFSLLGLCLWMLGGRLRTAAVVAFVLAFFSRQSAIAAPVAVFAAHALERPGVRRLWPAALYGALVAAGFGVCRLAFGPAFFLDAFTYNAAPVPYDVRVALRAVVMTPLLYWVPVGAAVVLLRRDVRARRISPIALYVILGAVMTAAIGREGAYRGYFFDLAAGLAIAIGLAWPSIEAASASRAVRAAALVQGALLVAGIFWGLPVSEVRVGIDRQRDAAIEAAYRAHPGVVLSSDQGFCLVSGVDNASTDIYKLNQLVRYGTLPRTFFVDLISRGRFSLVIVRKASAGWVFMEGESRQALERRYRVESENATDLFYVPRAP